MGIGCGMSDSEAMGHRLKEGGRIGVSERGKDNGRSMHNGVRSVRCRGREQVVSDVIQCDMLRWELVSASHSGL